jgi:hypothetical protein
LAECNTFFDGNFFVCLGESHTNEENVTWSEGDLLFCSYLFDEVERDYCALEGREGDVVLFGVGSNIDQDAAANDAAVVDPCLFESMRPSLKRGVVYCLQSIPRTSVASMVSCEVPL